MLSQGHPPLHVEQDEGRGGGGNEHSALVQQKFTERDHERRLAGQAGRALDGRLRALNFNLWVMGCHAVTCLVGCLQASSADKVLRPEESYLKSLLFISIKGVLFHLLTVTSGRTTLGLL